ncbi:pknH-like extracellular domain protein [Mycobacterium kansasii]|uniref:PknH-like extracellular domain protein n=1 Tax=Mycobacterium kansasii TaxID=1768 RepID=A0A1V3WEJ7_MYCKA|nr:pknH-like extracellular domain protein [Mycobacterium kansasii]
MHTRRTPAPADRVSPHCARALLAGVALALLLTGCTATTTGHPAAAPDLGRWQPPAILPQHLGDLLLTESDVNTIGHTTAMAVRKPVTRMWHDEDVVSDPTCLDTYSPAEATVYQGSNWNAVQGQILDDAAPVRPEHAMLQVLVGFRDADSAQQFFSQAKTRWSGCANRSITITAPGTLPSPGSSARRRPPTPPWPPRKLSPMAAAPPASAPWGWPTTSSSTPCGAASTPAAKPARSSPKSPHQSPTPDPATAAASRAAAEIDSAPP